MSTKKKATKEEKEALEKYLLQFLNIEKQYPLLPGISNRGAMAELIGIEEDELIKLRERFSQNAKEAALELLKDDEVIEWIDNLPFKSGDTIVAFGDSSTDDLQSWFEILSELLSISRPESEFIFVNAGESYNTTSEAMRRMHRDVLTLDPDWVIVSLGSFDTLRLPYAPKRTLLPLAETWENLSTIEDAIETVTDNPPIWLTPTPTIPGLLDKMELFDFDINDADLAQVRQIIAGKTGYVVDPLGKRMGNPPEAWYYLSDGLNPSLSGHVNTVRALLYTLVSSDQKDGAKIEPENSVD